MKKGITKAVVVVTGVDLGDKASQVCALSAGGERLFEKKVQTSEKGLRGVFGKLEGCRVVMEAGGQSGWISRLLREMGHEVKVVNPRKMRRIYENESKSDVVDARELADAGLYRWDKLPVVYLRDRVSQEKLSVLRSRDALVRARTGLVNLVRSLLKQEGVRVSKGTTEAFAKKALPLVPEGLAVAVNPLLGQIAVLTGEIRQLDKWIARAGEKEPEVKALQQIGGVGAVTAAAYVWTIGEPSRFAKSRAVGSFLGMRPRRDQSGETDKQLPITKAGNPFLRRLLVGCAHYILGPHGPDTALRRWGLKLAERGGKRAKRKAVVAVARKLAVLLHHLWVTGEVYEPFPEVAGQRAA